MAEPNELSALAERIDRFLAAHAKSSADFDPASDDPAERFNGPDSALLFAAARSLHAGDIPPPVHSSWSSGCYRGDSSARQEHEDLLDAVIELGNRARLRGGLQR